MSMKMTAKRRAVVAGLGMTALAACTPRWPWREEAERPSEGGVGGTGIVGILTARNRLSINGLSLAAAEDVTVRDAFGLRSPEALAVGQALTVEAATDEAGTLVAREISVSYPVIGPIEALGAGGFRSLGVEVRLEPGALLADPDGVPFAPELGQRVAVSGLWRGAQVVASRVDLLDRADAPVAVAGEVKPGTPPGTVRLGGLQLLLPAGAAAPAVGSFATAVGLRAGPALVAESIEEGRFRGAAGPLQRLSVEGYLEPSPAAPGYAVSGLGHSFDRDARLAALTASRALFVGTYDGDFRVRLGLPLPEDLAARRQQLAALEDGFAPAGALSTR